MNTHEVVKTNLFLPESPRSIEPALTFNALVDWLRQTAIAKDIPGLIIGISGTDSILAFLACAKAFEQLGKPERVLGIHYGAVFPPANKTEAEVARIVELNPSFRWVVRTIMPWLRQQAPQAILQVDNAIDYHDDYQRWASLFRASLNGASKTEPLPAGKNYWVVGTKNATEDMLGTYSNISAAVSLQPVMHLWKSEILRICGYLGVPQVAIAQSRQVDCDCGRFEIAAHNIESVDHLLMIRKKVLSSSYLQNRLSPDLLQQLESFVEQQITYAAFKKEIPYRPAFDMVL